MLAAYQATNLTWGLESNLFFAIALAIVVAEDSGRPAWPLLPILVLCRPDGAIFAGLLIARMAFARRPVLLPIAILVGVVGAWAVWHRLTYGVFLPNTFSAKLWQGRSGLWGSGPIYLIGYVTAFKQKLVLRSALWIAALAGLPLVWKWRSTMLVLALAVVVQQTAYAVLNIPAYGWYYVPLESFLLVLCLANGARLVQTQEHDGRLVPLGALVASASCFGLILSSRLPRVDGRDQMYATAIEALDKASPASGPVVALEVGTIGYRTSRRVIDLVSLTTPNREYVSGENTTEFFRARYPLLIFHDPISPLERAVAEDPMFEVFYAPDHRVKDTPGMKVYRRKEGVTEPSPDDIKRMITAKYPPMTPGARINIQSSTNVRVFLERVNGFCSVKPGISIDRGWLLIEGWTTSDVADEVVLRAADESTFCVNAVPVERPDVQSKFGPGARGFHAVASTFDLKPGRYELLLAKRSGASIQAMRACELTLR
jgi:hypothetical protein